MNIQKLLNATLNLSALTDIGGHKAGDDAMAELTAFSDLSNISNWEEFKANRLALIEAIFDHESPLISGNCCDSKYTTIKDILTESLTTKVRIKGAAQSNREAQKLFLDKAFDFAHRREEQGLGGHVNCDNVRGHALAGYMQCLLSTKGFDEDRFSKILDVVHTLPVHQRKNICESVLDYASRDESALTSLTKKIEEPLGENKIPSVLHANLFVDAAKNIGDVALKKVIVLSAVNVVNVGKAEHDDNYQTVGKIFGVLNESPDLKADTEVKQQVKSLLWVVKDRAITPESTQSIASFILRGSITNGHEFEEGIYRAEKLLKKFLTLDDLPAETPVLTSSFATAVVKENADDVHGRRAWFIPVGGYLGKQEPHILMFAASQTTISDDDLSGLANFYQRAALDAENLKPLLNQDKDTQLSLDGIAKGVADAGGTQYTVLKAG